jgi:general L-amino acid transport system permease protein
MTSSKSSSSVVPFWRDVRVYRIAAQVLFVVVIVFVGYVLWSNLMRGLAKFSNTLGFDFLQAGASIPLSETTIEYDASDPYYYAFFIGALNTLRVIIIGIVLASILGLVGGIARLSSNWLVAKISAVYVEIFLDTPLLIQLYFWYLVGVLRLPRVRESIELPGPVYLSNRGIVIPWVEPSASFGSWLIVGGVALVAAIVLYVWFGRLSETAAARVWRGVWAFLFFTIAAIVAAIALNAFTPSSPEIKGFNYDGGLSFSSSYAALVIGLVTYTGAFISEIVRAGILAVPRGLNEASRAVGLTYTQTLRLVTVPLALRTIIPPLTNQYLNLAKNSSLAVAIAFPDLYYVGRTIFNQTGQTIQIVAMIMGTYLLISLAISLFMNQLNARFALVER